jgi:hypothetical protein
LLLLGLDSCCWSRTGVFIERNPEIEGPRCPSSLWHSKSNIERRGATIPPSSNIGANIEHHMVSLPADGEWVYKTITGKSDRNARPTSHHSHHSICPGKSGQDERMVNFNLLFDRDPKGFIPQRHASIAFEWRKAVGLSSAVTFSSGCVRRLQIQYRSKLASVVTRNKEKREYPLFCCVG